MRVKNNDMNTKNKKYERTKEPVSIKEIIRIEYPLFAERLEKNKKIEKHLCMKNKVSIFVASKPNSILLTSKVVAIFFAANLWLSTLADCCTLRSVIEFGDLGGDSLFYTLIFHSQMPNSMKSESKVNNSNRTFTQAKRNAADLSNYQLSLFNKVKLQFLKSNAFYDKLTKFFGKDFETEKNAKNEAYFFILSHGLYNQFVDYCKNYHSSNPHKDCVDYLLSKI